MTQANTVYPAKAKFILTRKGHSQINTVYCVMAVSALLNEREKIKSNKKEKLENHHGGLSATKSSTFI